LEFIRNNDFDKLYLVGDFIDVWALRRGIFWPQSHNDVIQKILRKARKGTRVIYIPGNHDSFVDTFFGEFGAIQIKENDIHITANGKRILVIHGDELDCVIQHMGWLGKLGSLGYSLLLEINKLVNLARWLLGREYWSLSAYVKNEVKNIVSFIGKFESQVVRYARSYNVDAVLCGHIHYAARRMIEDVEYLNCGDWVENSSAIVEHEDGSLQLLEHLQLPSKAETSVSVNGKIRSRTNSPAVVPDSPKPLPG
jgi:UDP-2,3-diacylglucosamine pyrophosphatase LpxH